MCEKEKIALCVLLASLLILVLALPLITSATAFPAATKSHATMVDAKSPDPDKMKLVREGTVYNATSSILDVEIGNMDFDASPELVVYSKEYDPAVGQYYFQVTVVDGKTLTAQWSFQSAYELDQVMLGNIDLDEPQEVISVCKSTNTTTVRDNDGTILWAKDYGEPVVATVISDQNDDGANDLLVFSTTCYTDLFGNYWWKYFMEDVEDDTTIVSGNVYLPNTIHPYRVLAVDWNLTTPGEEIISLDTYEDEYHVVFINPSDKDDLNNMEVEKYLNLQREGWMEIDTVVSEDGYISFFDYDMNKGVYRIVALDSVAYTYWVYETSGYPRFLYFVEIDGDAEPELLACTSDKLLTFNMESGTPLETLSATYPNVLPLDLDLDGVHEYILYGEFDLITMRYDRLLNSTTLTREVDVEPASTSVNFTGWYSLDGELMLLGVEYTSSGVILAVYSLKEANPPTVSIISPSNGAEVTTCNVTVEWNGSDDTGIDHFEVRLDGGSWINVGTNTSYTFTDLSEGSHTVEVRAFDEAGNTATATVTFTVKTLAPIVAVMASLALMQQGVSPLVYVGGGAAIVIAVAVGVALWLRRRT